MLNQLDFLGQMAHTFQTDEQNVLNLTLRPLETSEHYILYLLKDKSFEAVEAELRERGLHEDIIESDMYQLRHDIDDADEIFYTDIAAIDSLDRIKFEDANPVDQQIHLATKFIVDKDYDQAELHLRGALELDPEAALAYANLGVIALRKNDMKRALELFNQVLSITPTQVQALTYKMYILSGSETATLTEFTTVVDQLLALRPHHAGAMKYKWCLIHHSQDLYDIIEYTKLSFKLNYLEKEAMDNLLNVVLWLTPNEGREFLDELASEVKGNLIHDILATFRKRHDLLVAKMPSPDVVIMEVMGADLEAEMKRRKKK